jgi:release factor glutamine methyltransferase
VTAIEALERAQQALAARGSDTPRLDAEILLRHVLGIDRTTLFSRLREPMAAEPLEAFQELIAAREQMIPVAYLTGTREFMGIPFAVAPGVLIPRPETEILVEWALDWLRGRTTATVVDVGTGSGAIAVSIAASVPTNWRGEVIAVDVSETALEIARQNVERQGLASRIELLHGSLLAWCKRSVDLILANLPYLRPDQIDGNRMLAAEPRLALDGGADGLDLIRDLLDEAPRLLAPGGAIGLEIDPSQSAAVLSHARQTFPGATISALDDLAGLARHLIIETHGPS